jgi:DNA-binding beta-propeller fold protein YncE
MMLSDGELRYELVADWAKIPAEVRVGDVAAVSVDRHDNVYLFTRGEHPVIVLNPDGDVLRTWGHGMFVRPHGMHIGPDDCIYCTDEGDHTVRKCTLEGKVLLQIGVPGKPAAIMSSRPFHRCTHTALSPQGDIYVSDGYGNACIHKFAPDGRHLLTWGRSGSGPGEFYVPHNLVCDVEGWVYVADRENHRVQVFDTSGHYEAQWNNLHRPCAFCLGGGPERRFYVGELGPALTPFLNFPNLGPRLSILDATGQPLVRLSAGPSRVGRFIAPHGIAVNSLGDIYVGEVSYTAWPMVFPDVEAPAFVPTLYKLHPLGVADRRRHRGVQS